MGCNCGGGSRLQPTTVARPVNGGNQVQGGNAPGYPVQSNPNAPVVTGGVQLAQRKVI